MMYVYMPLGLFVDLHYLSIYLIYRDNNSLWRPLIKCPLYDCGYLFSKWLFIGGASALFGLDKRLYHTNMLRAIRMPHSHRWAALNKGLV